MNISRKDLFVKKSSLTNSGKGLFTRVNIQKGDRIVEYKGRRQPWKEVKAEDGYNRYLLRLNHTAINALPYKTAIGRFSNDATGPERAKGLLNNAEYLIRGNR